MRSIFVHFALLIVLGFLAVQNEFFYSKNPVDALWTLETPSKLLAYPNQQTPGVFLGKRGLSLIQRGQYRSDILRKTFAKPYSSLKIELEESSGVLALVVGERRESWIGHMPQSAVLLVRPNAIRLNKFGFSWIETDSIELKHQNGKLGVQTKSGFILLGYFQPQTLEFQTVESNSFIRSIDIKDSQGKPLLSKQYDQTQMSSVELFLFLGISFILCFGVVHLGSIAWPWLCFPYAVLLYEQEWTSLFDRYGLTLQQNERYFFAILSLSLVPLLGHWLALLLRRPYLMRTPNPKNAGFALGVGSILITSLNEPFMFATLSFLPLIWLLKDNLFVVLGFSVSLVVLGSSWGGLLACCFLLAAPKAQHFKSFCLLAIIGTFELMLSSFSPLSNQILNQESQRRQIQKVHSNSCGQNPLLIQALGSSGLIGFHGTSSSPLSYLSFIQEQACSKIPLKLSFNYNQDARLSEMIEHSKTFDPQTPLIIQFGANDLLKPALSYSALSFLPKPVLTLLRQSTLISLTELLSLSFSSQTVKKLSGQLRTFEQRNTPTLVVLDVVNANYTERIVKLQTHLHNQFASSSNISIIDTVQAIEGRDPDKLLANQTGLSQHGHQQLAAALAKDYIDWFFQIQRSSKDTP
ncbi:MAG: hypothetical protein CMK59_05380 [Proteobacteria bacterium]|nr:hypothetical protein [Pseudomonadota bacterium]